jgi:hypothetical protein
MQVDRWDGIGRQTTASRSRRAIDAESPALSLAYFPLQGCEDGCETCPKNTSSQRTLRIEDAQKSRCRSGLL